MINPDFDPMQDLEDCMFAIQNINELVNKLIEVHNSLARENAKLLSLAQATNKRIDNLERDICNLNNRLSQVEIHAVK